MTQDKVSSDAEAPAPDALTQIEAKREARKAAARKVADDALAVDLEAIDEIETQLGDTNVATVRVGYISGLPAAVAVKCPSPGLMKRFRDRVKPGQKDGRNRDIEPDHVGACEELAAACLVYPADKDVYAQLCAKRPGLAGQLGKEAVKLAVGAEESDSKS